MTNRTIASIGIAGALASAALLGGTVVETGRAVANRVGSGADDRAAEKAAEKAAKALKRDKVEEAIRYAETAVALMPGDGSHRALLGRAYLGAGRFESARTALIDSLSLDGANGSAALNLSLAQIATGDWAGARATLDAHQATIAVRDRGLAMALAGDPEGAVAVLQIAARAPDADATTRQNLALALALAGRWAESKVVAAMDVAPGELNDRMMQWLAFAQPQGAADQVAALLGVTPVLDQGLPTGLALTAKPGVDVAAGDPVDRFMPGTPGADALAQAAAAEPEDVMVAAATAAVPEPVSAAPEPELVTAAVEASVVEVAPVRSHVVFAARREIVQPIPMALARKPAPVTPVTKANVPAMLAAIPATGPERSVRKPGRPTRAGEQVAVKVPANGSWYVQLGAFDNAAVAQARWQVLSRKVDILSGHQPQGVRATVNGATYYRLSVGGFARQDAVEMCGTVRRAGGHCFVRQEAGDQMAAWLKQPTRVSARAKANLMAARSRPARAVARPILLASR